MLTVTDILAGHPGISYSEVVRAWRTAHCLTQRRAEPLVSELVRCLADQGAITMVRLICPEIGLDRCYFYPQQAGTEPGVMRVCMPGAG
jgi:hypothetical protein